MVVGDDSCIREVIRGGQSSAGRPVATVAGSGGNSEHRNRIEDQGPMKIPRFHLDNIGKIGGFALSNARAGEETSVCTRASLTSDDGLFYEIMEAVSAAILSKANLFVNGIYQFLAVLHDDDTADLYVNEFPVLVNTTAKADMAKGQVVSLNDIADIQSLEFEGSLISETDKLIYCFKVGWKFGLFFDLKRQSAPDYRLNLEQVGESIGGLYRYLAFQHVYKTLESKPQFEQMMSDGWFPFVELLGSDFKFLSQVYNAMFDVDTRISQLLQKFDAARISRITERWWRHPFLSKKQPILRAGVNAFLQNTHEGDILCLKTLLSEIEGLMRMQLYDDRGIAKPRVERMTEYVREKGLLRSGSETSLLLPMQFTEYLNNVVFRDFDLVSGSVTLSRHSSAHGVASPGDYTRAKALQAILTLDQIQFYL
jgi:hypothetical protein